MTCSPSPSTTSIVVSWLPYAEAGAARVTGLGRSKVVLRHGVLSKKSLDNGQQPLDFRIPVLAEEIGALYRTERSIAADVQLRDITVIEPDRNKPRDIWASEPHLFDRQVELLVLVAFLTGQAFAGETS